MKNNFLRDNRDFKNVSLEILRLSIIAVVFVFLSTSYGLFYGLYAFIPAIYAFSSYRNGFVASISGVILIYVPALFLLFGTNYNLIGFNFVIASAGIVFGDVHFTKRDILTTILTGIFYLAVSITVLTSLEYDLLNMNAVLESGETIDLILQQVKSISNDIKISNEEIKTALLSVQPYIILIISSQTVVFGYYAFSELFSSKMDKSIGTWDFKKLSIPRITLPVFLIILVLMNVLPLVLDFDFTFIYVNLFSILSYAFFIQGLAFVEFFAISKLNRFVKVILVQIILFTFIIPLYPFFSFLGVLDYFFNFRKLEY